MRHKYTTEGIVLSRYPLGEASMLVTLITQELGLVRARAQGLRKPGAKLAPALQTFVSSDVTLVRGKEGWRLSGAILAHDYFATLTPLMRERAGRIALLMLRLMSGDEAQADAHTIFEDLLVALGGSPEEDHDALETLAALYLLRTLGLDAGSDIPLTDGHFGTAAIQYAKDNRTEVIARVNRGIHSSGL